MNGPDLPHHRQEEFPDPTPDAHDAGLIINRGVTPESLLGDKLQESRGLCNQLADEGKKRIILSHIEEAIKVYKACYE